MSKFPIYDRDDFFENSTWFTKVDSEDECRHCEKRVAYCLQVGDISLYLCTTCALNAREKIVEGLLSKVKK